MLACENSGHDITCDFPEVRKILKAGASEKPVTDYELTRYACYLILQNGDPRKEVIALGQTYFAIQTYRQEVADIFNQLDEDSRRLVVHGDIKTCEFSKSESSHIFYYINIKIILYYLKLCHFYGIIKTYN